MTTPILPDSLYRLLTEHRTRLRVLENSYRIDQDVEASQADKVASTVRAAYGQTANIQEWYDGYGDLVAYIAADGTFHGPTAGFQEVAYAQRTTNLVGTGLITSLPSVPFDGSEIAYLEFGASTAYNNTVDRLVIILLYEDGIQKANLGQFQAKGSGNAWGGPLNAAMRFTPANGSHTYAVYLSADVGTPTLYAGTGTGGAHRPAFLRLSKLAG